MRRLKITAPTGDSYEQIVALLVAEERPLYLLSPKRQMIATAELSDDLQRRIEMLGGVIGDDRQYALEH